jgi:hypothetical protein
MLSKNQLPVEARTEKKCQKKHLSAQRNFSLSAHAANIRNQSSSTKASRTSKNHFLLTY